jgi:hypothetical protein
MRRGAVGARAGLKVGHRVLYVVTNVIGGKTSVSSFEAEVLELPRPHLAKISLNLQGKVFTPTVKRSHLEYPSDVPKPTDAMTPPALRATSPAARGGQRRRP